jgi:transposase
MVQNEPTERTCPDCGDVMTLVHRGRFSTLFTCPTCGITLTLPPREPVALPKDAPA